MLETFFRAKFETLPRPIAVYIYEEMVREGSLEEIGR